MQNSKLCAILTSFLFFAGFFLVPALVAPAAATDMEATKELYLDKCAKCHGESGKGDGRKAKTLKKKPRDYTDKEKMGELTDEDMLKAISEGKKPMPAYNKGRNKLTEEQMKDLVAYIRTFAE